MGSIGQAISKARRAKGWTQEDMAGYADVSLEWVRGVEQERVKHPRAENVAKAARALGIEPSSLFSGEAVVLDADDNGISVERVQALNASLLTMQKLSPRRFAEVQRLIEYMHGLDQEDFQKGSGEL